MSKEFSYYNTDSFIDDLQELVSLDLSQSNVHIDTHVTTSNILADGVVYSSNISNQALIETLDLSANTATFQDIQLSNISLSSVKPNELHPSGYIDFSWLKADPLSNVVFIDKWGAFGNGVGATAGGAAAAALAGTWYSAPLVSPAGAEGLVVPNRQEVSLLEMTATN